MLTCGKMMLCRYLKPFLALKKEKNLMFFQVIFHVATLMPNKENDPRCDKKKRHIGNDYVSIIYNNAGDSQEYKISTVKAAFMFACVVITPLDQGSNRVEIQCRPELEEPLEHIRVNHFCFRKLILYYSIDFVLLVMITKVHNY